jgi:SAM-dependent methyltransferase
MDRREALMQEDHTRRFSDRVDYYVRYRPRYPRELLEFFVSDLGLRRDHLVADIGSGTGFLAELFLSNGNMVFGVEPNGEMREAAEELLRGYPLFRSVDGTAEATGLGDRSIDFITIAQAFHWFDLDRARREFLRVLKPGGIVAIVWNNRRIDSTPFSIAYEEVVRNTRTDHDYVASLGISAMEPATMERFFGAGGFREARFDNEQLFDFEGLQGRLLSSSYAPLPGHPNHDAMIAALRNVFDKHQEDGKVAIEYDTEVYYGKLE